MTETLAVAGVVIVVAAAVGGGLKLLGAEVPVMSSVARQLLAGVIGGSLLAAAFVAEAYEGDPTVTTIAPSPPAALRPAGQITVPAGGRVTRQMLAAGQARHVPFGSSLFLLVERGRYYPQKGVVPLRPDGHWAATVSFGNSDNAWRRIHAAPRGGGACQRGRVRSLLQGDDLSWSVRRGVTARPHLPRLGRRRTRVTRLGSDACRA